MVVKSGRKLGITEAYWASLNEDKKLKWKVFSRVVALIGALIVTKTEVRSLDWCIAAMATLFSIFLIETQRTYSRYSIGLRKMLVRVSIGLGSWCAVFLGVIYFSQVAIFAIFSTFSSMQYSGETKYPELKLVFYVTIFFFGSLIGVLKAFRDLKVEDLIYHMPRRQLKRLLIQREFKVENIYAFAYFELGIVAITICYSSGVGMLLGGLVKLMVV